MFYPLNYRAKVIFECKNTIFLSDMQGAKLERVLLSIITVCYNADQALVRTMDSVAEQTFRNFEYIIIDGASEDGTLQIIHERRAEVDQWISEPDTGIYNAMNKGIKMAKGEYLCFMNAGDCFHAPSTLSDLFASIGSQRPDVLYGQTNLVDNVGNYLRPRRLSAPKKLTKRSFLRGMLVCHQSFYPKRDLAPMYDESYRYSSDYDWCLNILGRSRSNYYSGLVLTDYLSEGMTTQHRRASLVERFKIMRKHFGIMPTLFAHFYITFRLIFHR